MTFSSFSGLQNTVKMNEYVLTLEQDIRSVQRAAMLLERNSGEKWIYGLGIDFGDIKNTDGKYTVFKWCSPFDDYGNIATRSALPAYDPNDDLGILIGYGNDRNGYIYVSGGILANNNCELSAHTSTLRILSGYSQSSTTPKSAISIASINDNVNPRYVIFESVSGRAFFYDDQGVLLNFDSTGKLVENPESFVITIDPYSNGNTRIISIGNLSGKVTMQSTK